MAQLSFDDSLVDRLEAMYRSRDVLRRRRLIHEALAIQPGERVLDVGCGPGFFAAELAGATGGDGVVVGIDASPQMLAVAARRCETLPNVSFRQSDATRLPVDDGSFDVALCVQVLEYVPDVPAALAELNRALRPGGRVLVWDVDWTTVSWHSADPARMERILRAWDGHLAHPALPRTLGSLMRQAGFADVHLTGHAFAATELSADAYVGSVLPLIEQFLAGREDVPADECAGWAREQNELEAAGAFYFTCTQLCFTASRAS